MLLTIALSVTGCAKELSDLKGLFSSDTVIVTKVVCPAIKDYDVETQAKAKAEFDALPPGSVIRGFVRDYQGLREQVRACRGKTAR